MAFFSGRFQSAKAAPDDGFAATVVPVNSAEHFTTYLRSAEMTEEANYNMIDGLMNNTPKKKDKNAPRRSVLKRLHNHQKKIASQGKGQPQQQKAMEEEMERKKK